MGGWFRSLGTGLLAGGLAGVVVLGVGGRLVMSLIALRADFRVGYSIVGTLEVIVTGLLFGLAGGLVYGALLRLIRRPPRWAGAALGLLYFVGLALLPPPAARMAASGVPQHRSFVLVVFGALFLAYGVVLAAVAGRLAAGQPHPAER